MNAGQKTTHRGGTGVDDAHVCLPAQPRDRLVDLLLQHAGGDMRLWERLQMEAAKQRMGAST